jgi:hypothetical protein
MKVTSNYQPRNVLYWEDLSEKEQSEFDYLETELQREFARFVRYKGEVISLEEFTVIGHNSNQSTLEGNPYLELSGWQAIRTDSHFSGIVAKYPDNDGDRIILGTCFS